MVRWAPVWFCGFFSSAQRGALERAGLVLLARRAQLIPHPAAHRVQRRGGPGHHVEGVLAQHRLRGPLADDVVDPLRAVRGDLVELGASLRAEQVEEAAQRGLVAALARPHQPPGVVVDHAEQETPACAVGNLVDPDPVQPRQPVGAPSQLRDHPDHDRRHRPPRHPQQDRQRRERHMGGQPRRGVLETGAEPRPVPRPRHRDHRHPVLDAGHPRRLGLQIHPGGAQIHTPPAAPALATVITRTTPPAPPTPTPTRAGRTHPHHHHLAPTIGLQLH